jgi:Flp pilus assembly protein CpaB
MVLAGALGVLLTLSVVHETDRTRAVFVAAHDLAPGAVLDAGAIRLTRVHADAAVNASLFGAEQRASLRGRVVTGAIAGGALLTRDNVRDASDGATPRVMSFPLPKARAVDGKLARGDRIDIVAVDHEHGRAQYVMHDALVVDVDARGSGALSGTDDDVTVTIDVDANTAPRLAAAVDTQVVSLVRTVSAS